MAAEPSSLAMLRPMREADLDAIGIIEQRAYEFPWTQSIFRDCLRAGYHGCVLYFAAEIVGYFVLSVAAGEAHLLNLCVDPSEQGRGHGRRLLRRSLDLARWHRVERMFLEVRPSNPGAVALYASSGFRQIGRRPRYYPAAHGREDALVMALDLLFDPAPRVL
ncbi:MAG: ribosomal protein S18-alanine N-acetyltransferase [Lysobacterales bacterium]